LARSLDAEFGFDGFHDMELENERRIRVSAYFEGIVSTLQERAR